MVGLGGTDREPLPLTEWVIDTLYGADLPVIAVDVAERPDVADLRRAGEAGNGLTGTTAWSAEFQRPKALLALDVAISSPVHCRFRVQFELPEHRNLVLTIIRAQLTVITVSPIGEDRLWEEERALPFTIPDYQNIVKNAVATVDGWDE